MQIRDLGIELEMLNSDQRQLTIFRSQIEPAKQEHKLLQLCPAFWDSLSTRFSRQEYWSELPCPPPWIFQTQGWNLHLLCFLHCWRFFTHWVTWEAPQIGILKYKDGKRKDMAKMESRTTQSSSPPTCTPNSNYLQRTIDENNLKISTTEDIKKKPQWHEWVEAKMEPCTTPESLSTEVKYWLKLSWLGNVKMQKQRIAVGLQNW